MPLRASTCRVLVGVLVVLLTSGNCTCPAYCPGTGERYCDAQRDPDAGRDAAVRRDGGRDTGLDVGFDANQDTGPPPAAGWEHFGDLPADCRVDVATHPENALARGEWESCGSGCLRWSAGRIWTQWPTGVDGRVWVISSVDLYSVVALLGQDGTPLVALRSPIRSERGVGCDVHAASRGDTVAVTAQLYEFSADGMRQLRGWGRFYRSTIDDLVSATPIATVDPMFEGIQTVDVSASRIAIETNGSLAWAIEPDGTVTIASRPFYPDYVQELHMLDDDVVWTTWGDRVRLAHARPGEVADILYEVAGGDFRSFAVGTDTIAWVEARERDPETGAYGHMELWTGTYDGERLTGHRVRDLTQRGRGSAGGGYYGQIEIHPDGVTQVYAIYRLSDGAVAYVPSIDGVPAQQIAYLTETDMLFQTFETVFRIDPRTLTFE